MVAPAAVTVALSTSSQLGVTLPVVGYVSLPAGIIALTGLVLMVLFGSALLVLVIRFDQFVNVARGLGASGWSLVSWLSAGVVVTLRRISSGWRYVCYRTREHTMAQGRVALNLIWLRRDTPVSSLVAKTA